MQYYLITNAILILFFISFFFLLFQWVIKAFDFKEFLVILLFSIGIAFIFKFPFSFHFLGLEYEYSYIFNISARQFSENIYSVSFLTDGINAGSLSEPISTVTYGGHFITYSVFISWFYNIFGYNIYLPSYLNTFIEFLTVLTLSISFRSVFGFQKYWFIPGCIYSLAPSMNLFGTTHLSETFSSFIVMMSILSFFYFYQSSKRSVLFVFGICFITALITKRENTVLLVLFIIFALYKAISSGRNRISNLLPLLVSIVILIVFLYFIQNIFLIEKIESSEISANTFRLSNFMKLAPVFLKAMIDFRWFNIFLLAFIPSILFILFNRQSHFIQLSVLLLYFAYFLIYTMHYRSYYFVHFYDVKPFDALRYLKNFYVISTLIISFCLYEHTSNLIFKKLLIPISSIFLIISMFNTYILRKQFSSIESENRFLNPKLVLKHLNREEHSILITDNILIFQLLGDRNLELIDLTSFDKFSDKLKNRNVYLFMTSFNKSEYFIHRYPDIYKKIQMMKKYEIIKFEDDDCLYKIE